MGHFQVQFTGPLGDNIASVSYTGNHGWKIDFTDGMQVNGSVTKIPDSPHSSVHLLSVKDKVKQQKKKSVLLIVLLYLL